MKQGLTRHEMSAQEVSWSCMLHLCVYLEQHLCNFWIILNHLADGEDLKGGGNCQPNCYLQDSQLLATEAGSNKAGGSVTLQMHATSKWLYGKIYHIALVCFCWRNAICIKSCWSTSGLNMRILCQWVSTSDKIYATSSEKCHLIHSVSFIICIILLTNSCSQLTAAS